LSYVGANRFFKLRVDRKNKLVWLEVFEKRKLYEAKIFWTFDELKQRLELKLKYLCFIRLDKKFQQNKKFVKLRTAALFRLKGFDEFITLLESGKIFLNIKIGVYKSGKRLGQTYNHGSSFNICESNLNLLFDKITF
jgi:hypothetical protein